MSFGPGLGHRQTRVTPFVNLSDILNMPNSFNLIHVIFLFSIFFRFGWMQQLRFFSPWDQVLGSCWLMPATTNSTTTATSEFYLIL